MRRALPVLATILGILAGLFLVPAAAHGAAPPSGSPPVVPRPAQWEDLGGTVGLTERSRIVVDPASRSRTALPAGRQELPGPARQTTRELAEQLRDEIREVSGLAPDVTTRPVRPRKGDIRLRLTDDARLGAEGYRFDSSDVIRIDAAGTHGLYYGTRTLLQTLRAGEDHRAVPRARSLDRPTQRVRMVHLDAGRKYWELDHLENLIRRMGDQKLNTLFLHLSESEGFRLYSPKFPGLADPEHSYSRADIERLKALAARHHVQLMPGLEVPGHATVISEAFGIGFGAGANPCTGEHTHSHLTADWIIDMTSEKAVEKTKEIVDEFAGWFDAPLFSIGAEEVPGQLGECPRVKEFLAEDPDVSTLGDLLNRYINTLDDVVARHGKRTAVYNGSEHMAAPQQRVHGSVVFLTWEGTGSEPVIPGHDEIAIGPFYVTPNNYHNLYPDQPWMYGTWKPDSAPDMLGSGVMNWADYNFWAEDGYFEQHSAGPRAVLADRSWNGSPPPDSLAGFRARVAAIGDPPGVRQRPAKQRVDDGRPSHHWTFDEASYPSGWTYAGSPGNTIMAEDTAGGLPGTTYIINNPALVGGGVRGEAFRFDHDRDGVGFGGLDVTEPWTASVWVRPTSTEGEQVLLSSESGALKLRQSGTGEVGLSRATGSGTADHSFDYTLPFDRWVHLTWVAEPGRTTLYVDGERVGSVDASVPLPMRSVGAPKVSLRGDLDELTTWDEALSPGQVGDRFEGYGR
ncbi:family 20 glycosylhydrolase [Streptomyces luteolus]|uniref:beta-N-acetylhexosaminidase n=1 Tax=Streptomyces luteolus TaxID=3043615 RepID=A0ABT6SQD8_9ACTN|nr:family 20 glycosylhydrolase [Streptomyces sp. B-S-A12]MDI3417812.1 family 20 glycosylhydrolase [Streptomyces sp. B-S-A12]